MEEINMLDLRRELEAFLPSKHVLTRPIERYAYAHDASYYRMIPQAVVQPASSEDIRRLFAFSQAQNIPLVFRAGGTSLSGQSITDGILVDISKHWRGYTIAAQGQNIELEPGIVGAGANILLKPYKRRIGPDPASIDAAMIGGILANNSSGMCCGVVENAYQTLVSLKLVLPNGLILDTANPQAQQQLAEEAPQILNGLSDLRRRIAANPDLREKITHKYHTKNTTGYGLNALVDFSDPLDILNHLMIGSEGTLGFIAGAVLRTLPVYPFKYTGLLFFRSGQDACDAILPLHASGARAIELMDRASLRSVEEHPGMPPFLKELPESAACLLVEYQCLTAVEFSAIRANADATLRDLHLLFPPDMTEDAAQQARLWKVRKGILPAVGGARPHGTTVIIEDITFPVARMAEGLTGLQKLFQRYDYSEAVIFGHAKDGNLHFIITPSFNDEASIQRYDAFMRAIVDLVVNRFGGALKAEHGSGRNMAPFIEAEWGAEAYQIMKDLKSLFDPRNLLNPDVIINPDPQAHLKHLKPLPVVEAEVDRCMECGFCEPHCPSRRLTLTPRQRIVLRREAVYLQESGSDPAGLASIRKDYTYYGIDTCAVDGLCASACPVSINTGDLTKHLRAAAISERASQIAVNLAHHFGTVEGGLRLAVGTAHIAQTITGADFVTGVSKIGEKLSGQRLFKWNAHVTRPTSPRLPRSQRDLAEAVYFPACISRTIGTPPEPGSRSLIETLVTLSERAKTPIWIPADSPGHCCGMPFSSKGYSKAFAETLHTTLHAFWEWSDRGRLPVIADSSSCAYTLKTGQKYLNPEDLEIWSKLTLLDCIEFAHDTLLPRLTIKPLPISVVLHPNCSARKQELDGKLIQIARACAAAVTVPENLNCCGFAGDRGLLFPELTLSATQDETAEVLSKTYDGYYSTNLTCEIGMRMATKKPYRSFLYLLEEATR
jgi:D-lactate dehydrogenase